MRFLLFSFLVCVLVSGAYAHGFENTQSVMSGSHRVEFGITGPPRAGERVGMSLSIDDPVTDTPITADKVSVRISKGDDIHFISSGFRLTNETVLTMSFIFPEPGEYTIDIIAGDDRAAFTVVVDGIAFNIFHAMAAGIIVGAAVMWMIMRRRSDAG